MKLVVCLILAAVLFQCTFAVSSRATQKKMLIEKINRSLEKSVYGRAMKNMVSLASKLKYDYTDLDNAFNELAGNLNAKLQVENELYDAQVITHDEALGRIQTEIDKQTVLVAEFTAEVEETERQLAVAEATLAGHTSNLAQTRKNLAEAQEERDELIAFHEKDVKDYKEALAFIREAVRDLEAAQVKFENANLGEFSFVEVKNPMIAFVSKMSTATQRMSASHQLFVKPVVMALNQIANSSADPSSIQVAIDALNGLDAYFSRALNAAEANFTKDLEAIESRIKTFEELIVLLVNKLIPEVEDEISHLNGKLEIAKDNLKIAEKNLADAKQEYEDEVARFEKVTQRHIALVNKISNEINLVLEAQSIINEAKARLEA